MRFVLLIALIAALPQNGESQGDAVDTNSLKGLVQAYDEPMTNLRWTLDGRLCAETFVQNDQTFTDCTDTPGPGGSSGGEWCYVAVQLLGKGPTDWGLCQPKKDRDLVRRHLYRAFDMKMAESEKMIERMDGEISRLYDMQNRFNATCGVQHEAVSDRVGKIESLVARSNHCLSRIQESTAKVEVLKSTVEQYEEDVQKDESSALRMPENCEAVPGYEDEPYPDGIRAAFYGNGIFEGEPRGFLDLKSVNIVSSGKSLVEGVPHQEFSARLDTYIKPPHTGNYIFAAETNGGCRVFLNEKPIIVYRMPEPSPGDAVGNNIVPSVATRAKAGTHSTDSLPQRLEGGQRHKLRIEWWHSNSQLYDNPDVAILKLRWRSGSISDQLITPEYFFKSNSKPPVKIFGLDGKNFDITFLYNGERAFTDSSLYFLADVPQRYAGYKTIRTRQDPTMEVFSVHLSGPSTLYIASSIDEPMPVAPPDDFFWKAHESEDILSVYKAPTAAVRALNSHMFKIKFIEKREGGEVKFNVMHKHKPFIMFVEPLKGSDYTCGGEEEVVSLTGGPLFQGCESSSQESPAFGCDEGLNGRHMDQEGGIWRTSGGNGAGEYLVVRFKKPVQISEFRYKTRDSLMNSPSELALVFTEDNDDAITITIPGSSKLNSYRLEKPVITKYVKVEITATHVSGVNSGASFEFVGTSCSEDTVLAKEPEEIQIERCDETVYNLATFLPLEEGKQFIALCPSGCVSSPEGRVFGDDIYSPDSTLCTACYHAGACSSGLETPRAIVTVTGPKDAFTSSTKNGISSQSHGPSSASLMFSAAGPESTLQAGKPMKYAISFRSGSNANLPQGYMVDSGEVKQQHSGIFYGWLRPATSETCSVVSDNPLSSGGVSFPHASSSEECRTGENCQGNFWSISVEPGNYRVEVQLGSPCEPYEGTRSYYLEVNGIPLATGMKLSKGQSYWAVAEVDASEKLITVTSTCQPFEEGEDVCKNAIATIMNIVLEKVNSETPNATEEL